MTVIIKYRNGLYLPSTNDAMKSTLNYGEMIHLSNSYFHLY